VPASPGLRRARCRPHHGAGSATHRYAQWTEHAVLAGQAALRRCLALAGQGFVPDLCVAHPGWGDALFLREAFPRAKILAYCEHFWRAEGADVGCDPGTPPDLDARCALRLRNGPLLVTLEAAEMGLAPTEWQRALHPPSFQPMIRVVHDGIDTARLRPDPTASFTTPSGKTFRPGDEVVTYVARGLEPQRGFPALLRALHLHLSVPFALSWSLSWSLTEAMATACLVLGSDTDPVREFITDGANGFLVDPRDPKAIARRAAELLAKRAGLLAVREAARRTFEARCALEPGPAAQAALIDSLLA
jgi:glycosyltransferase involved in cell wall biosynthesis